MKNHSNCYFKIEIKIDDSKYETLDFMINDISINFDMVITTDFAHQSVTISVNDVKINKYQNGSLFTL